MGSRFHAIGACLKSCGVAVAAVMLLFGGIERAWAGGTATSTTLAVMSGGVSVTSVMQGSVVTLTATVKAGSAAVTPGQVDFCDASAAFCTDVHLLAKAQLTKAGVATYSFIPGAGAHSYKAIFLGTNTDAGSSSVPGALSVAAPGVGTSASVTTLASSGVPGSYSLIATVKGTGSIFPTGNVLFVDTSNSAFPNYVLGSGSLGVGAAGLSLVDHSSTTVGMYPQSIVTADFNGDGIPDIATVTINNTANYNPGSLTILLGKGDGTFTAAPNVATGGFPVSLVVGDFNGDGIPDVAFSDDQNWAITVLLGNGDGTFRAGSVIPGTTLNEPAVAATGDFNNDGNEDLVVVDVASNLVTVYRGNGDGTFSASAGSYATGDNPVLAVVGDFNHDGKLDIAVDSIFAAGGKLTPTDLTILLGNGDGTFVAGTPVPVGIGPEGIVTADFNGDGNLDLAVANIEPPATVMVMLGDGKGGFSAPVSTIPIVYLNTLAVGDVNGDGKADIVAPLPGPGAGGNVYALLGNGDGTFTTVTGNEPNIATSAVVADFNGDGRPDIGVMDQTDTITLMLSEWSGTATATVSGISPVGMGTHYIDANFAGDNNYVASGSGTIPLTAEPVATTLALSESSTSSIYGQQVTLTATLAPNLAQDHNAANNVTFYNNGASVGTGAVSGGVATLNVTTLPVGSDSLTAVYAGDTNFVGSTSSVVAHNVQPAGLTEPVGSTTAVQTALVTFTASGTVGAIAVLTQDAPNLDYAFVSGGTCIVGSAYTVGQSCTVEYTFTPTHPGARYGGVTLMTAAGALLGNGYISGIGTGPQITWNPGKQLALGTGLSSPNGVAVDGNGNAYVAEYGKVVEIAPSGAMTTFPITTGDLTDVAVDGSGNVFVVNQLNGYGAVVNEILAVNGSIPATPVIRTIAAGFITLHGIAVDGNGDLFLTQSYSTGTDCAIYEIPSVNGNIPAAPNVLTLATNFGASTCGPSGVAVDASGDLFVSDWNANSVYELLAVNGSIPATPTIRTLANGFNSPFNVALDAAGDVFVADFSNSAVKEIVAVNGSIPATNPTILTLGSGFKLPTGVAVDGSGNVFVSDAGLNQIVKLDFADPPSLNFANTAVGSTSSDSPQSVTMTNDGNEPLLFIAPTNGNFPIITAGFTVGSGSTCPLLTTGSASTTLAVGGSCNYVVSFTPVSVGADNGDLQPVTNNLNTLGGFQKVPLNGTGTGGPPAPVVTSVVPNSGPDTGGTVVTVTGLNFTGATAVMFANLAATSFQVNSDTSITVASPNLGYQALVDVTVTTPGGTSATSAADYFTFTAASQTITFPQPTSPANEYLAVQLTATASSGLPVTYKVVSGSAIVGSGGVVYSGTGPVVIEADQAGNSVYAAAAPVQVTVNVVPLSVPVGSKSLGQYLYGVVTMTTSGTLGKISILTQGAPNLEFNFNQVGSVDGDLPPSCAQGQAYVAGQMCIVAFYFAPRYPGIRYGGITATTSSGALLGTGYISGIGTGPMATWSNGAQTSLGSGFIKPAGIAMDGAGNIFVADANNGVKEILAAGGYTTVNPIGSGFTDPVAVALDGAGNVFVADYEANTVKEILATGGYSTVVQLAPGYANFSEPAGIAVDVNGNVFVTNFANNQVNEISAASGYSTVTTLGSGFSYPSGIAVDANDNVFVVNTYSGIIQELGACGCTTTKTIGTAISGATGLALDGEGNLFIADDSRSVDELTVASGYTTMITLSSGFAAPDGVIVDGTGNVYVAQHGSPPSIIKLDYADPPSLMFKTTAVGQTSSDSPQTVTVTNDGNEELNFSAPVSGTNPSISTGFTFTSSCPILEVGNGALYGVQPGFSCTNAVSFKPTMAGTISGDLVLTDDNLNQGITAMQKVPLNGFGTSALIATTSVLTVTPAGPFTVGETITLTGTVTAAASSGTAITGTMTFYDNSTVIGVVPIASGGLASMAFVLPAGSNALGCIYSGDSTYATSSCAGDVISAGSTQTITFVPPTQAYAGTSVLLTATGGGSGNPVVFSVVSGPAMVSGTNGQILTYTGAGSVVIEADQAGNSVYSAAPPDQVTVKSSLLTAGVGSMATAYTYVTFSAAGTLANLNVLTQGMAGYDFQLTSGAPNPCAVGTTYAVGQYCGIEFTFTPPHPGLRYGGTPLTAADGTLLANSYIYGLGQGPQITWTPGKQSAIGSGFASPVGVSVDISGDVFVADMGGNAVYEIPAGGGAIRTLGSFLAPDDVTVDGSGNVFVIWGTNRSTLSEIMAVNGVIPATPVIRTITTALSGLDGAKVDGNGNVFLAAGYLTVNGVQQTTGGVQEVVAVNGSIPASPTVLTLSSAFVNPTGVAVDANGNVFVSDQYNPSALEIQAVNGVIPANPKIVTVGSGFTEPSNIALDAAGDVFVTDAGAAAGTGLVYEILAVNGVVPANPTIITLGIGTKSPQGTIVDQSGDVYIADDELTQIIKLDYTTPPTLTFADTLVGQTSTDSPQTVTMANDGNEPLTFIVPSGQSFDPVISSGFTDASASTCLRNLTSSLSTPLYPGESCTDVVSFTPLSAQTYMGTMTTYDNNLGVLSASQIVYLNGKGLGIAPTLTFAVPDHVDTDPPFTVAAVSNSPGAITYTVLSGPANVLGNVVTLTGVSGVVTIQASQAASGAYLAATATATFNVTKAPQTITFIAPVTPVAPTVPPITLVATASSGLPVTFSVLSGPATVSGNVLTITGPCANVVVAADQAGNATYAPAPEVTHTISVTGCTATLTLTAAPNPVFLLNPVTLTATLSFTAGTPTGTIQFLDGTTPIGSGAVSNGVAVMMTSTLSLGSHTITAIYGGDVNFAKSTSNSVVELVEDFSLTITNPVLTISHGGTATYDLVVTTVGGTGMAATVSLTMSGAPDTSKITFTPASVPTGSGTTDVSLVIATPDYPVGPWGEASAGVFGLGALVLMLRRKRRRLVGVALVLAASLMLGTMSGCGWGWGPQHFALTVTASSGPLVRTATARLTSQ